MLPVPADRERVRQVLWNLLLNAAQAMPDRGSISILVRQRADHVEVRVVDTGVGISPIEGQDLDPVVLPEPVRSPKRPNPAFRRNSGSGQNDDVAYLGHCPQVA